MFLAALANCPDLEFLKLVRAGPGPPISHRDDFHVVVRLRKLRELFLSFLDAPMVSCILSCIRYPESAFLEARAPARGTTPSGYGTCVLLKPSKPSPYTRQAYQMSGLTRAMGRICKDLETVSTVSQRVLTDALGESIPGTKRSEP